ncbi:hypothetical protein TELCIR_00863 [Teladorsagia circumcincta]|uniref:Uncharacterized protein n=1 Tax=Teladorsagia circumcincta TaxID=45464 RepID=A0A2G9V3F2_TELCI|nr:hypothetical protein TELCIR_00863 [Teladorsagia circumcincta]
MLQEFPVCSWLSPWCSSCAVGKCTGNTRPSRENIAGAVIRCLWLAGTRTFFGRSSKPVAHWLDRAAPEFSPEMIQAVRSFVNVAAIFGPLVFFWALFDQQGSTWVLQARRLNGRIGWLTVLPEQINILNPLIVLIMVPVFEGIIYPCARKVVLHITYCDFEMLHDSKGSEIVLAHLGTMSFFLHMPSRMYLMKQY